MDPPYKDKNLNLLLDNIKNEKILKENGILIIHRHKDEKDIIPNKLKIIEEKKYGLSKIIFLSILINNFFVSIFYQLNSRLIIWI
jgi:16S rRNA (guanine966-N2)-methyltransferase